ncbi:hypothetical protein BGZ94_008744, partial [Podila epigama]
MLAANSPRVNKSPPETMQSTSDSSALNTVPEKCDMDKDEEESVLKSSLLKSSLFKNHHQQSPRPYEIPEILFLIGRHLPYWKRAGYHLAQGWVLDPSHWLACMLVCRSWYLTFKPLIFFEMDDTSFTRIPLAILEQNTRHVQRLHLRLSNPAAFLFLHGNDSSSSSSGSGSSTEKSTNNSLGDTNSNDTIYNDTVSITSGDATTTQTTAQITAQITAASDSMISTTPRSNKFTHLRVLELLQYGEWTTQLIVHNPGLEKLTWRGGDFHSDDYKRLDYATLIQLYQLRVLKLDCWKIVDPGEFLAILEKNKTTLCTLALEFCKGGIRVDDSLLQKKPQQKLQQGQRLLQERSASAPAFPLTRTMTNSLESQMSQQSLYRPVEEPRLSVTPPPPAPILQLPYLTRLVVCKDIDSGPMEDLIRFCPNLQTLSWTGPNDKDLLRLIRNLKLVRSKVTNVTYAVIDLTQDEHVYAQFVMCFQGLTELQIKVPTLAIPLPMTMVSVRAGSSGAPITITKLILDGGNNNNNNSNIRFIARTGVTKERTIGFTEALLQHRLTLQILDLKIVRRLSTEPSNIVRLLTRCERLRALSIDGSNCRAADLCSIEWQCRGLRKLMLTGLHESTRGLLEEDDNWKVARALRWQGDGDDQPDDEEEEEEEEEEAAAEAKGGTS